jgi:hypothetical protein
MSIITTTAPKENTVEETKRHSLYTVATIPDGGDGSQVIIQLDADNQQLLLQKIAADGTAITTTPQAILSLVDVAALAAAATPFTAVDGADANKPILLKARELQLCIGGFVRYALMLAGGLYTKDGEGASVPCGGGGTMNYRGTYDPGVTYNKFDVVRKQSGPSQGVWISVNDTPMTGTDPAWTEPGGTWELLAFGVQATSVCSGGTKTVYFNALPPS